MRFELPATDGTLHGPGEAGAAPATVVVFTCNHCPYALAWHERLIAVAEEYAPRGVQTFHVSSNDAERYPRDAPEAMRARVEAGEFGSVPYLYDETQDVARAYGARTTPDVFVLDANLDVAYRGAPDADYGDPSLDAGWLRQALDAVLDGASPDPAETEPVGCSVKWRS
jgi:protein-disulfide isomerase